MSIHSSFAALVLLAACGGPPAAPEPVTGPTQLAAQDIAVVSRTSIAAGPRVSGSLDAAEKAVIRSEAGGSVEQVAAEIGQRVKKGDLLARIESNVAVQGAEGASAGVAAAEQDALMAEREVARVGKLVEVGALAARDKEMADSSLIAAQARLKDARARRATASDQVSGTVVRSPIDGIVSERSVSLGDVVAPGSPLFTVLEPSSLRLNGAVPADSVGALKVGAAVELTVQGHPDKRFAGMVERIAPAVDTVTRQIPVLVSIPNTSGELIAGLFAEGRVAVEVHDGLVVPTDALIVDGEKTSVLRVKAGAAEKVAVTVGLRDEDAERAEITGVDAGDVVIVGPARDMVPGTQVQVPTAGTPAKTASEG